MICKTNELHGILPEVGQYATLFCRSPQFGVPGGTIGSGAGVPSGYYFVVTDILANCGYASACNGVSFGVSRRNVSDIQTELEWWVFPLSTSAISDASVSVQAAFAGPLMILAAGDYLTGEQYGYGPGGTPLMRAQVMGYLTAKPETFRP